MKYWSLRHDGDAVTEEPHLRSGIDEHESGPAMIAASECNASSAVRRSSARIDAQIVKQATATTTIRFMAADLQPGVPGSTKMSPLARAAYIASAPNVLTLN